MARAAIARSSRQGPSGFLTAQASPWVARYASYCARAPAAVRVEPVACPRAALWAFPRPFSRGRRPCTPCSPSLKSRPAFTARWRLQWAESRLNSPMPTDTCASARCATSEQGRRCCRLSSVVDVGHPRTTQRRPRDGPRDNLGASSFPLPAATSNIDQLS